MYIDTKRHLSAAEITMDDDGASRCSSGGLSALSHQLMRKFTTANKDCLTGGVESRPASTNNNLVFSPLSIYSALSLVAAVAKSRESLAENMRCMVERALPDGGTQKHKSLAENVCCMVKRALSDTGTQGGGPRVEHACGLWYDAARTLKPAYHNVAAASCKAHFAMAAI
jgi:serpin B